MFDNTQHYALDVILVGGVIAADMRHRVTLTTLLLMASLSLPCFGQITYWISGFHRQGNAEDARNYLGIGFVTSNWFTTATNGATIPVALLTNITFVQIDSNTWWMATNVVKYTNTTDMVGLLNANFGIGSNVSTFYQGGGDVLTNLRTAKTLFLNAMGVSNSIVGGKTLQLYADAGGTHLIDNTGSWIDFVGTTIQFQYPPVAQSDVNVDIGDSTHRWRDFYIGRNIRQIGPSPFCLFSNNATGFYAEITNGVVTASNYVSKYVRWNDLQVNYGLSATGPNVPTLTPITNDSAIQIYGFDNNDIAYCQAQLPHNIAITNAAYPVWSFEPHVHFHTTMPGRPDVTHSNVTWRIEWQLVDINAQPGNGVFKEGTNSVTFMVQANFTHYMAEFGNITVDPPPNISAVFSARLTRPASALIDYDTTANPNPHVVLLDGFDLHIPIGNRSIIGSASDNEP